MPALRTRDKQPQSMEIGTDAPSLPMLAVIAPTPRAFTFPTSHNLDISPYSTPSNSPFEPDLNSFSPTSSASSYLHTPPTSIRTLSPDPSVSVSSPSSNDAERRPKKGDEDYVKRPENAFILFRRKCCEDRQQEGEGNGLNKKQRQADLSKTISQKWKNLSEKDRQYWEELAKEKKKKHQELYPDYVYRPQRARDTDGRVRNKKYTKRIRGGKAQHNVETDGETRTAYVVSPARSPSASMLPPVAYHTVHIPIIRPRPSCPSSPSLGNVASNFSHFPNFSPVSIAQETGLQLSFYPPSATTGQINETSLQSSDLMRSLFNLPTQGPELNVVTSGQLQLPSPSSSEPSPISGPITPSSVLFDQTAFAQLSVFDTTDASHQIPSNLDVQIAMPSEINLNHISYMAPWDHNILWQRESSMLMSSDFDLHVIPPIELGQVKYADDGAIFGISPEATLAPFPVQDFSQGYDQEFLPVDTSSEGFDLMGSNLPHFDECAPAS